jgi:hypothetical protein
MCKVRLAEFSDENDRIRLIPPIWGISPSIHLFRVASADGPKRGQCGCYRARTGRCRRSSTSRYCFCFATGRSSPPSFCATRFMWLCRCTLKFGSESAELTDINPAEDRADLVVLLVDGKPVLGIVVEVQLSPDPRKRFTWPVYVAARLKCPACVLVVTPTEDVARWCRQPIDMGPGSALSPPVIGPASVPVIDNVAAAERDPELAVLSVIAHGDEAHAEVLGRAALLATLRCPTSGRCYTPTGFSLHFRNRPGPPWGTSWLAVPTSFRASSPRNTRPRGALRAWPRGALRPYWLCPKLVVFASRMRCGLAFSPARTSRNSMLGSVRP